MTCLPSTGQARRPALGNPKPCNPLQRHSQGRRCRGVLQPGSATAQQLEWREDDDTVQTPGPDAFSLQSRIFTDGLPEAMLRFSQTYGPVARFANPAALNAAAGWLFVNSPDDVQHICATNTRNYAERYLPDIYLLVTHEKGLLGSSGDYNRRHRRLCAPPFRSPAVLQRASHVANTFCQRAATGGPFLTNVAVQTQRLTLDVVGLTAFSHNFQQCDQIARDLEGTAVPAASDQDRLLWAVNAFGQVLAEVFITPMPLLRLMDALGFKQLRTLHEAMGVMRDSMLGVIAERRRELAAVGAGGTPEEELPARDVLDILLQAKDDDGVPMTDQELWEDVHDVMGAGHETTATTAAAAVYCVSSHPEVEARLLAELDSVLGGRPPTYEDLEQLPYLQAVMRLHPAIPIFPRKASATDRLPSGHRVLEGDVVFMSSYALHRAPELWEDPLRFDPDRFLGEREAALHRFQFLPFGAGPRMCLGSMFAEMSVSLMTATLLQRCRFRPVHPASPLPPIAYDITLNFDRTGGLKMEVAPR
eukprot:scaffold84.g4562.t1